MSRWANAIRPPHMFRGGPPARNDHQRQIPNHDRWLDPYSSGITTTLHGRLTGFAQLIKVYRAASEGEGRYSPADVAPVEVVPVMGQPDPERICTSLGSRRAASMRTLQMGIARKCWRAFAILTIFVACLVVAGSLVTTDLGMFAWPIWLIAIAAAWLAASELRKR